MANAKDELKRLREFLALMEDPSTFYKRGREDIKPREIDVLKREIAHLEEILTRRGNA